MNKQVLTGFLLVAGLMILGAGCASTRYQTSTAIGQPAVAAAPAAIGRYVDYTPAVLAQAEASGHRTVLFFAALGWCPSCQRADRDFKEHFDQVPKDVTILVVNYDTEKALEQQYGVTHQDTFIQVDSQGRAIAQWSGGGQGVQPLLDNLK